MAGFGTGTLPVIESATGTLIVIVVCHVTRRFAPRLRVTDARGQTWQPSSGPLDWQGWNYVEFDLKPSTPHWGGANDGVMHFPLSWDSVFLLDNSSKKAMQGTVYLAAPVVIY